MAPDLRWFVVIGAQKCGTTSLFRDLQGLLGPGVPETKERGWFNDDKIFSRSSAKRFHGSYSECVSGALCGDVSTSYAKRDEFPGVPNRVRKVLGEGTKVIYMVREPVARAISHHRFESGMGLMPSDFTQALRQNPAIVNNSRYGHQLEPWLGEFSAQQVLVVSFHEYVSDRLLGLERIAAFLGYQGAVTESNSMNERHNPTQGQKVPSGFLGSVVMSDPYQRIKTRFPSSIRGQLKDALLSESKAIPTQPSSEDLASMSESFAEDAEVYKALTGSSLASKFAPGDHVL